MYTCCVYFLCGVCVYVCMLCIYYCVVCMSVCVMRYFWVEVFWLMLLYVWYVCMLCMYCCMVCMCVLCVISGQKSSDLCCCMVYMCVYMLCGMCVLCVCCCMVCMCVLCVIFRYKSSGFVQTHPDHHLFSCSSEYFPTVPSFSSTKNKSHRHVSTGCHHHI